MRFSTVKACCLLIALGLGGCSSTYAHSERQILPSFQSREFSKKRLFIAPYAVEALDHERAVPLESDEMKAIARVFKDRDPNRAALKAFYSTGAEGAKSSVDRLGLDLAVVDLPNARWHDYFQDKEQFLNVTVDGKLRYQIPDQKLLHDLGVEADFTVVLGALAYTTTTTITSNGQTRSRRDSADFEGRFLVWDYRGSQVLAEGKVECSVGTGHEATADILPDLGRLTTEEILAKPPFRG